jgi:NAD(P)-dependent dehydrogenase (short-subunit alcohol dehydrogenase family)
VTTLLHYASSKGAVVAATKVLARGMGEYNITVNAVAPGLIWTEAQLAMIGPERAQQHVDSAQFIKQPLQAEHIAGGVVFLASDDADMVTGHTLFINAGEYI